MARKIITLMTDDLDGSEAAETVQFALDGVSYTIDLSDRNASELRESLERFIQAGVKLGKIDTGTNSVRPLPRSGVSHPNFQANKELNIKIREWANENGYGVAERGRIPQHVVDAYYTGRPASGMGQQMDVLREPELPIAELPPSVAHTAPAKKTAPRRRTRASA